jgi:hypothetical protein
MHPSNSFLTSAIALLAATTLAACGGGESATSDTDTAVTDVDPGEGDGTINDTTLIDGTIGAEEAMGMESRMPRDASDQPPPAAAPAEETQEEAEAPAPTPPPAEDPEPEADEPAETETEAE